jgi:hypothetical protein
MTDQVFEDETCSGVVALVVGEYNILRDVFRGEIFHRGDLMLEWGASAHVVCSRGGQVFGGSSFGPDCAIVLRDVDIGVLI